MWLSKTAGLVVGIRRIIAELIVLNQQPHDVDPEAVDSAFEPEA